MFDFLHSILKCPFLNRIQTDRIFYHQVCDRNGSRKSSHTSRAHCALRVLGDSCRSYIIKITGFNHVVLISAPFNSYVRLALIEAPKVRFK